MKAFQKPLTAGEEKEYLQRWRTGEAKAKDVLIERNMRLVAHVSKKYNGDGRDLDDLISIGTIGLIKAVNTFDPDKNSKLATYAAKCIDNEILMSLRLEKKYGKEVSLYDPIGTDKEGNMISLVDVVETGEREVVEQVQLSQEIREMYEAYEHCLKDKEKLVIRLRYGLFGNREYTQREIAKQLGISRSYVSRIEKAALLKMRAGME
ncbi:MAG: RNA polymerase sporulation sigma factor SigK [Lachnospiraceae bacterium]|jgi:RNA polymerase sporulation-specific sigma factor|nr:RNA polymerase sporulation sigma factor SigK [Lachnospiraceae bacterium]